MTSELVRKVRSAAVMGAGGTPAWLKLARSAETVVANGVEHQPLARADRGAMTRYPAEIVRGLKLALQATNARTGVLALREDMADAREALEAEIAREPTLEERVRVACVPPVYPAGEERQVALAVTGKAAPAGGSPQDAGVAVLGVRTLLAIAEAARDQASTHQLVAVMGAVEKPAIIWAPRGIALKRLVAAAGGPTTGPETAYIPGGPLAGAVAGPETPLRYGVSLLVILPRDHPAVRAHDVPLATHLRRGLAACENCEQCTRLCPANLVGQPVEPHKVMRAIAYGLDGLTAAVASASYCIGCGLCTYYACPVGLAPSVVTLAVKRRLAEGGFAPPLAAAEPKPEWTDRRVPLDRLLARLDLARYDVPAPMAGTVATDRVLLPLDLPSGLLASPVVRDGHRVKAGQRVADVPDGAPGVPIVASIAGAVRLTPAGIEIRA